MMNSSTYLIVIPNNCTSDIHICGRCKTQFTVLNHFLEHKLLGCCIIQPVSKDERTHYDSILQSAILNNEKEAAENLPVDDPRDVRADDVHCARRITLLPEEEDVATLLANQLSGHEHDSSADPDKIDDPTLTDANYSSNQKRNLDKNNLNIDTQPLTKPEDYNDDQQGTGVLYRGKVRSLFRCEVSGCLYKSHMKKDIDRHSRTHTGERPYKCYLCSKTFTRGDKLLLHQRMHSGDKRYKCTYCTYAAVDSGSLIKHLRIHNGERPFKCQLCSYCAKSSSQIVVHLRSHTGDSPFICTQEKCRSAFKTNSDLKRHMAIHAETKPHSCPYCQYKSTFKGSLQLHIENHHSSSEYRCVQCADLVFPTIRKLKAHMRKCHSRDMEVKEDKKVKKMKPDIKKLTKNYTCSQCVASFVCLKSLKIHEKFHEKTTKDLLEKQQKQDAANVESTDDRLRRDHEIPQRLKRSEDLDPAMDKRDLNLLASEIALLEQVSLVDNLRASDVFSSMQHSSRLVMNNPSIFQDSLHSTVAIT